MARAWRDTPALVRAVARAERPAARVVVLGHTHYPGMWNAPRAEGEPGLRVVNTGSFARPFGGLFVELTGERVRVVRIVEAGGEFRPGRVVAEWTLKK
jgi:predicted phosphodiesterase